MQPCVSVLGMSNQLDRLDGEEDLRMQTEMRDRLHSNYTCKVKTLACQGFFASTPEYNNKCKRSGGTKVLGR